MRACFAKAHINFQSCIYLNEYFVNTLNFCMHITIVVKHNARKASKKFYNSPTTLIYIYIYIIRSLPRS